MQIHQDLNDLKPEGAPFPIVLPLEVSYPMAVALLNQELKYYDTHTRPRRRRTFLGRMLSRYDDWRWRLVDAWEILRGRARAMPR